MFIGTKSVITYQSNFIKSPFLNQSPRSFAEVQK